MYRLRELEAPGYIVDTQLKTVAVKSGEVTLVISDRPGAYALQRAEQAGIPAAEISRKACGSQALFEEKLNAALTENRTDLIVLAGFLSILSEAFTIRWARRIINVHPSLIPSFCGAGFYGLKVHEAALKAGVKLTGATVHIVDAVPDGLTEIVSIFLPLDLLVPAVALRMIQR